MSEAMSPTREQKAVAAELRARARSYGKKTDDLHDLAERFDGCSALTAKEWMAVYAEVARILTEIAAHFDGGEK